MEVLVFVTSQSMEILFITHHLGGALIAVSDSKHANQVEKKSKRRYLLNMITIDLLHKTKFKHTQSFSLRDNCFVLSLHFKLPTTLYPLSVFISTLLLSLLIFFRQGMHMYHIDKSSTSMQLYMARSAMAWSSGTRTLVYSGSTTP